MDLISFFKKHWIGIIFFTFALFYVFWTYMPWLEANCVAPVGADTKGYISNLQSFKEQLETYKFTYPVEFTKDVTGFYWYYYLPLPLIIPAIFSIFLSLNLAFFIVFLLVYAFAGLSFYFLLRHFCNKLVSILFSSVFLICILNKIFSVGGNYQFLMSLTFYFFALAFLFRYFKSNSKKDLTLFCLASFLLALTYTFTFVFLIAFVFVYAIYSKKYKFLIFPIFATLAASYVLLPVFVMSSANTGSSTDYGVIDTLNKFILPRNGLLSWLYLHTTNYDGRLDTNYGPQIIVATITLLVAAYILIKNRNKTPRRFLELNALTMLSFFTVMFLLHEKNPIPDERLIAVLIYSLFILSAFLLSELKLNLPALFGILAFGALVADKTMSTYYIFLAFVVFFTIICWLKDKNSFELKLNQKDLLIYINLFVLFLIIFPLTGRVETTTLYPRTNHFVLDESRNYINSNDIISYFGGYGLEDIIMTCSNSKAVNAWAAGNVGISIKGKVDVFDNSTKSYNLIKFLGLTKILISVEDIQNRGGEKAIAHLINWYGQPQVFNAHFKYGSVSAGDYPIAIFNTKSADSKKYFDIITPVKLSVTNSENSESILLPLRYHVWWYSDDKSIKISNSDGFVKLDGTMGKENIILRFNRIYFEIGAALSVIGVISLIYLLRKLKLQDATEVKQMPELK